MVQTRDLHNIKSKLRATSGKRKRNSPTLPSPRTYSFVRSQKNVILKKEMELARAFHERRYKELKKKLKNM